MMADGSVPWMSVKKTLTATSTVKVEFISCFEATSHGVCLENFIYGSSFFHSTSCVIINFQLAVSKLQNKARSRRFD